MRTLPIPFNAKKLGFPSYTPPPPPERRSKKVKDKDSGDFDSECLFEREEITQHKDDKSDGTGFFRGFLIGSFLDIF